MPAASPTTDSREMSPFDAVDLVLGAVEDADLSAAR